MQIRHRAPPVRGYRKGNSCGVCPLLRHVETGRAPSPRRHRGNRDTRRHGYNAATRRGMYPRACPQRRHTDEREGRRETCHYGDIAETGTRGDAARHVSTTATAASIMCLTPPPSPWRRGMTQCRQFKNEK
jgi:hypothetical protein